MKTSKLLFIFSILLVTSFSYAQEVDDFTIHLKPKNNRFMKCKGQGKDKNKVMVGVLNKEGPKNLKLNGQNYKITRMDPSSNGRGYVMMARSGQKFVRFIGTKRNVDRLKTKVFVGVRSESQNKDLVTGSFPLVCDMNPT